MKIRFIKVPFDLAAGTRGSADGPDVIVNIDLTQSLNNIGHKTEISKIPLDDNRFEGEDYLLGAKNLDATISVCEKLADTCYLCYGKKEFPVILGGDHSILMGSVAGVAKALRNENKKLGILYIDAHGDFNTNETTPTGNIHGECLSASCGIGLEKLTGIFFNERKVEPKNVCIIGARDLDSQEKVLLKEYSCKVYSATDVEIRGISAIIKESMDHLINNVDMVHVSFDVDSVDPIYAPGTGIHIPGGLTYREAITIAEILSKYDCISSLDVVEYDPKRDIENKTKRLCEDFLLHFFGELYK